MLHVGLDLSRKRLDFHALAQDGDTVEVGASPPDRDGLAGLARRLDRHGEPICAAIESMNGARFVHDQLEMAGWEVEIADAQKVKGIAPLACKTDRIDAWVLAELSRRDLVPAIWLPDPEVRAERERARFRLHLVKHRSSLKHRVHSVLCLGQALSGFGSVRPARARAPCNSQRSRALALACRDRGWDDRRPRPGDRWHRARAAQVWRRPPLPSRC